MLTRCACIDSPKFLRDQIRTKLGFALWNDLLARGKKELISENFDLSLFDEKAAMQSPSSTLQPETSTTPPKIQAKSSIYLASDKVMQYEEINTTMYGSDGCRVETIETTSMCSGNGKSQSLPFFNTSLTQFPLFFKTIA